MAGKSKPPMPKDHPSNAIVAPPDINKGLGRKEDVASGWKSDIPQTDEFGYPSNKGSSLPERAEWLSRTSPKEQIGDTRRWMAITAKSKEDFRNEAIQWAFDVRKYLLSVRSDEEAGCAQLFVELIALCRFHPEIPEIQDSFLNSLFEANGLSRTKNSGIFGSTPTWEENDALKKHAFEYFRFLKRHSSDMIVEVEGLPDASTDGPPSTRQPQAETGKATKQSKIELRGVEKSSAPRPGKGLEANSIVSESIDDILDIRKNSDVPVEIGAEKEELKLPLSEEEQHEKNLDAYLDFMKVPESERAVVIQRLKIEIARATRPKWAGRLERGGELAKLSAPAFLRKVHPDYVKDGTVENEIIRTIDPDLMRAVESYIANRKARGSADMGDAKDLKLALTHPGKGNPGFKGGKPTL